MIPVEWDEVEALELGALDAARERSGGHDHRDQGRLARRRAGRPLRRAQHRRRARRGRGRAAVPPRSCRATRKQRSPRSPSLVRSKSDARVVAVVGSTGKTSTKDILGALCSAVTPTIWAAESQNNEIGLPLTVCRLEPDTEMLVTEMGMRGLGQIAELCAIARPDVAVVSSIGPEHLELVGTVERVAEANAEAIVALPPGGIAVVPADAPELEPHLDRDDIEIRRFDRRAAQRRGPRVDVPARRRRAHADAAVHGPPHGREHARGADGLRGARASARAGTGRVRTRSRSRAGAARSRRCRAAASSSTTPTTPTRRRCGRRSSTSPRARAAGVASRSWARWPSSATRRPRYHEEIGALLDELGIELVIAVGEGARPYLGGGEPTPSRRWIPDAAAFDDVAEPPPAGRRDPRQGLARGRARRHPGLDRETGKSMVRVLIAGLVAMVIAIVIGPTFIEWLRRTGVGQQIREEGPARHIVKQGTPTMGGLLILATAVVPFLVALDVHAARAGAAVPHPRLRRDRLHGRLPQGAQAPLARPLGALEDARARADHDRRRLGRDAGRLPRHRDLLPDRRRQHRPRLVLLPVPLHRDRGHRERRQPDRRDRRARGGHLRDLAAHLPRDRGDLVDPLGRASASAATTTSTSRSSPPR